MKTQDEVALENIIRRNELLKRYSHHEIGGCWQETIDDIREIAFNFADYIDTLVDSREKSLALTKIEEAMFWANSAVARNQDK